MKTYQLKFKYENTEFEGILKYEEGKYLDFLDKEIYNLTLIKPFQKTFSHFLRRPNGVFGMWWYSKQTVSLDNTIKHIIDELLYYYFNNELEKKYKKLNEEYFNIELNKYDEFSKPYLEKINKLKEKQKELKKEFKTEKLNQKEYQFKRKELQQEINKLEMILFDKKFEIKSPYFECCRVKKEFQNQYDIDKVEVING